MFLRILIVFAALSVLGAGCAHYPVNAPLGESDPHHEYRYENLSHEGNSDKIFVVLTFSGGGGRAAALSYGVLEQLRDTEIMIDGEPRRLLDEVDVISSVSGGSFTAAYYALHGEEIFENYENEFLFESYQRKIILTALNPLQWLRYLSRNFTLTDRAAELYDRGLFQGATYGDLAQGSRPYIILNATDITLGQPFQFTQDQFDYLGSDLASVPLARGVTASSAVPVLLRPLTLQCYHPEVSPPLPEWVTRELATPEQISFAWQQANQLVFYRDPERCKYVHLVDGGIADNLGVRPLLRPHPRTDEDLSIGKLIDFDQIEHAVLITVNAANSPDFDWTLHSRAPSSFSILNRAIGGLMTNTTAAYTRQIRQSLSESEKDLDVDITAISIGFNDIQDMTTRHFFQNIATTLDLSPEVYQKLIAAGARLLAADPSYQALVEELGGTITPTQFDFDQ